LKTHSISFLTILLILTMLVPMVVLAAAPPGKLVKGPNGEFLQAPSPYPAASSCTTATVTKGTIATVTVAGYSQLCWEASDSNNAAKRIKRHLGSNTAYLPGTGGCLGLNKDMSTLVFKPYSGVGAAYTVCTELTRGGVTP
jgi:hypothetical protein